MWSTHGGRTRLSFPIRGSEADLDDQGSEHESAEELRIQLAAERAAREAAEKARERDQQRLDEIIRGPRPTPPADTVKPLGPAPDPSEDFEAFQRWQAEKDRRAQVELEARLKAEREEIQRSVTDESRTQMLWTRFQQKYPKHAAREALVRAAYVELRQRNALPSSPEAAVDAVAREMDALVGAPIDPSAVPADRSVGTGDGIRQVPPRRNRKADEGHSTTHEAITAQQIKYGLL